MFPHVLMLIAIGVAPVAQFIEAAAGGVLARVQDGDLVTVDCEQGTLQLHVEADALAARAPAAVPPSEAGWGRELFSVFRDNVSDANQGASVLFR